MHIGLDASNLIAGGGLTHLKSLLYAADPTKDRFSLITVWSAQSTLDQLPVDKPWLRLVTDPLLNGNRWQRAFWRKTRLPRLLEPIDILFAPGGLTVKCDKPVVTMSQNMLPFEFRELARFGVSINSGRYLLLHSEQKRSFRQADGLIFLTDYAENQVSRFLDLSGQKTATVPHGIDPSFRSEPRKQLDLDAYSAENPFRLFYLSIVNVYKHQWHVVEAVSELGRAGLPIHLDLVGPAYPPALKRLEEALEKFDANGEFVTYHGAVPHQELPQWYREADAFVYASSCENMPNILLEAMAAGLPIASSNMGPMPEMLGDGGLYFHPERPQEIARVLQQLLDDRDLRETLARRAYDRALEYSWERCARETFAFLRNVAQT